MFAYRRSITNNNSNQNNGTEIKTQKLNHPIVVNKESISSNAALYNFIFLSILISVFLILLRYKPNFIIYSVSYIIPTLLSITFYKCFARENAIICSISIAYPIYLLLCNFLKSHVENFGIIFEFISTIILKNILEIATLISILLLVCIFQGYSIAQSANYYSLLDKNFVLKLFLLSWSFFIGVLYIQVFISHIFINAITDNNIDRWSAFKLTMKSTGSIIYGSVIACLVYLSIFIFRLDSLEYIINKIRDMRSKGSDVKKIICFVSIILLIAIEKLVRHIK